MQFTRYLVPAVLALSLLSGSVFAADMAEASKAPAVTAMEPIPPKKDNDLRLFYVDGRMVPVPWRPPARA